MPFATITYQIISLQQSAQNNGKAVDSFLWGVTSFTGQPVNGTFQLTAYTTDGDNPDPLGVLVSELNTDLTQVHTDGFEWYPQVKNPPYNQVSTVFINVKAIVPGLPDLSGSSASSGTDLKVRCDRAKQFGNLGCINPFNFPTLTTMKQLPNIANNIRAAQAAGLPGAPGGTPLTRNNGEPEITNNRNAACSAAKIALLPPKPAGYECDEYPFASTTQGGASSRIAWVPALENSQQQGTSIADFQRAYRVLATDNFYVDVS